MFSELESISNLINSINGNNKTTITVCVGATVFFLIYGLVKLIFKQNNKEDDLNFNLTLEPSEQKGQSNYFLEVRKNIKSKIKINKIEHSIKGFEGGYERYERHIELDWSIYNSGEFCLEESKNRQKVGRYSYCLDPKPDHYVLTVKVYYTINGKKEKVKERKFPFRS